MKAGSRKRKGGRARANTEGKCVRAICPRCLGIGYIRPKTQREQQVLRAEVRRGGLVSSRGRLAPERCPSCLGHGVVAVPIT